MTPPASPPASPGPTPVPSKSNALRNAVVLIATVVAAILVLAYAVPRILVSTPTPSCPTGTVGTYPNCTTPPTPASITVTQTGVTTGCAFSFGSGPYTFTFTLVNTGDTGGTATVDFYLDGNYVTGNSFYVPGHSSVPESQSATSACGATSYGISLISVT